MTREKPGCRVCSKYMPKRALEHILTSDFLASSFTLFNRAKELFSYMLILHEDIHIIHPIPNLFRISIFS